ncbi:translation initiation factor IF-2 subunit alpha [Sulfodiicoccus acidiphilus]|uniref:Translation initiation factor IF-2 subunit alpha n=1 Tax=Sulfodiicoccus acidiphilus TaxID=1670455 RepID=A0A348B350_9CREN|nr:translation initiation factor IF-2 subunit alpha [Sulfodiicoccus acidiphilus]BBD72602.1 translation initiation factor IF-2 subunit alpha [Sulfodiicoccus acidiphilus]GGT93404.1 translation initiation factor IF-2 subunit alpha [Sulfodiicoccus acidiphilus]
MIKKRNKIPSVGDLVIGTVRDIFDYGSYLVLDEYSNVQAFLPWSEIASKWVRNVRNVIKEGEKKVVKVIRVDEKRGTVDVSLKKVTDDERKKKLLLWKKEQRADKILEIVAVKLGKTEDEAYEQVGWKLEDVYGTIMDGLEKGVKEGEEVLVKVGVPREWVKPLLDEASKHVEERKVKLSKVVSVRTTEKEGIEVIRKFLSTALDSEGNVRIYTIGAPRYKIEVTGVEPKEVNKELERILGELKEASKSAGVEFKVIE